MFKRTLKVAVTNMKSISLTSPVLKAEQVTSEFIDTMVVNNLAPVSV